jgi:hypothetical protein
MDEIVIRRALSRKEAVVQVLGRVRKQLEELVYAVKLLDPSVNFWGINFLPLSEADRAVVRTLLECAKCARREVIYLDEFEAEVYNANNYIFHACRSCNETTIFKESPHEYTEREAVKPPPSTYQAPPPPPPPPPAPLPRSERRHNRISCKLKACVRYQQYDDEILEVNDVSRGGLGFESPKYLPLGTKIQVAVPYSEGAGNIFVPAEIVRVREIPGKNLREYGASYGKSFVRRE